ncbi:hypothetical protein WN55_10077 [Dufourea novaeangliae]|uniref:Histone-lysine N-methyltransferase SETMAR n=1 Tax=Dufourea novaeangliae TaxID=178035 RepID=A0A154P7V7_DUFNO|nr:hypothetical protein WN55_10077 [Dufourea novaeangliae]
MPTKFYKDKKHGQRTFKNVCDKLRQTDSSSVRKSERRKRVTNEENEIGMLASVATNPHISSRRLNCGIVGDQIIGPHFIDGNLTGERYAHFIRSRLGTLLENVPLNVRQMIWLQHDGCPAHYARRVRDALNELYPNKWIGRGGLVSWPPRSPELSP